MTSRTDNDQKGTTMIKLPEPDECWSPNEVHQILLAFQTGELVPKGEAERSPEIKITNDEIIFQGYPIATLSSGPVPATVMAKFIEEITGEIL
jgi:hypothetical protein